MRNQHRRTASISYKRSRWKHSHKLQALYGEKFTSNTLTDAFWAVSHFFPATLGIGLQWPVSHPPRFTEVLRCSQKVTLVWPHLYPFPSSVPCFWWLIFTFPPWKKLHWPQNLGTKVNWILEATCPDFIFRTHFPKLGKLKWISQDQPAPGQTGTRIQAVWMHHAIYKGHATNEARIL